ncbi:dihydrofolate reductase [Vibrio sp. JC009]|uniref:dihydrofolate reductase n=1 Tax=Vibrio sp. JC009 TaxID=2912314 RepID=UPI0023B1E270|nr:dihydrofolate reductase [Vibrio sp. JC009]WED22981.1 dihydrofolate reductase [Vibrio sp. JC009]
MIRLAFVADKNDTVGCTKPEDRALRASQWPKGLIAEVEKMFFGENAIVGSVTYDHNIELFSQLDPGEKELLVLTRNEDFDLRGNAKATVVTDYMQVVDKYKSSEEILIVGGGAVVWELFLPYADEIVIACTDKPLAGDIRFSSWRDVPMVEERRVSWEGGTTYYLSFE